MVPRRNKISVAKFPRSGMRTLRTPYAVIKTRPTTLGFARVGVVIGAPALPRSVDRHFWKRRLYDTLLRHTPKGYDVLLIASSHIKDLNPRTLDAELGAICKKLFNS